MFNYLKIILSIATLFYLLTGCTSDDYMECNSQSNEKIIYNIIKKEQKATDFRIKIYDVYNKEINKETKNRRCHASLKILTLDKSFKTEIDYDVIKLLSSQSSHQVRVLNYSQTVGNLFYYQINPLIQKMKEEELAKEEGYNSYAEKQIFLKEQELRLAKIKEKKLALVKIKLEKMKAEKEQRLYKLQFFTVNLRDKNRYLKTKVNLLLMDSKYKPKINNDLKMIRMHITKLLTQTSLEDIAFKSKRQKVVLKIKEEINNIYKNQIVDSVKLIDLKII